MVAPSIRENLPLVLLLLTTAAAAVNQSMLTTSPWSSTRGGIVSSDEDVMSSEDDHRQYDHSALIFVRLITSYVCLLIGFPGICGNILIMLVNFRQERNSINAYMSALSLSNICFLVLWLSTNSIRYVVAVRVSGVFKADYDSSLWYVSACVRSQWASLPLINMTQICFILLTMMISVDRCICLRFSLRSHKYCSVKASISTIVLIVLFSVAYCLPFWFEYTYAVDHHQQVEQQNQNDHHSTQLKRRPSALRTHPPPQYHVVLTNFGLKHQKLLHSYLYIPVLYMIPFSVIIFCNIMIIKQTIEINRRKAAVTSASLDRRLTKVIVLIMVAFTLCQFPVLVLNILSVSTTFTKQPANAFALNILRCVCEVLIVINGSTNFGLYCCCSQRFKSAVYALITTTNQPKKPPNSAKKNQHS